MKKQKILLFLILVSLTILPLYIHAQGFVDPKITKALGNVGLAAIEIVAALCGVMIVFGGFVILTASGSPEKVSQGRQIILWAAVGLAIVILAFAIGATFSNIILK